MLVKFIVLVFLLVVAAFFDIKTKKIPNIIFYVGILSSVFFDVFLYPRSSKELLLSYAGAFIVFLFGSLRLLGIGDIKIWMVITAYWGIINSSSIICIASVLLILVNVLRDKNNLKLVFMSVSQMLNKQKTVIVDQKAYAFIPYITFVTLCFGFYLVIIC